MRVFHAVVVLTCIAPSGGTPVLRVPIRLINRAGLPASALGHIEREAARILARADIRLDFLECPAAGAPACAGPGSPGEIDMELLPGCSPANPKTLGYARVGLYAVVFCGRAEDLANEKIACRDDIIAHAIAHEAAHMLLSGDRHSLAGVMRPVWGREDLERIAMRSENFAPQETRALRAAARRTCAQ